MKHHHSPAAAHAPIHGGHPTATRRRKADRRITVTINQPVTHGGPPGMSPAVREALHHQHLERGLR